MTTTTIKRAAGSSQIWTDYGFEALARRSHEDIDNDDATTGAAGLCKYSKRPEFIELHCVEENRCGLDGVNLVRLAHHFGSVCPDFVKFFACDNYMINKCLGICDGCFVPSRNVGLLRVAYWSQQDRNVGQVYHLNDRNIEFCKKEAEHGFAIRRPTFRSCGVHPRLIWRA